MGADLVPAGEEDGRFRVFAFLTYVDSLRRAGAVPLILPPQPETMEELISSLDGVLLAGGDDCDPRAYGEENIACARLLDPRRQEADLLIARLARTAGLPLLGVCLGAQIMNVAAGGALIQDIPTMVEGALTHGGGPANRQRHEIELEPGSRINEILGSNRLEVNSGHHQAIGRIGEGLRVTARTADGVTEAIEDEAHPFYVGVQWHPEEMSDASSQQLFAAFVAACRG